MSLFRFHKNTPSELLYAIAQQMDKDIDRLSQHESISLGNRTLPPFDESKVYQEISRKINRNNKDYRHSTFKWACLILLLFGMGEITYHISKTEKPVYQQICAARGEKMVVILTDGSKVWLNADSKLTYPVIFQGKTRKVQLEGEAYFEVKKNADRPFVVDLKGMKIQVTGTKFNVRAYPEEDLIQTTLDEGKISVGKESSTSTYDLHPGQTAVYQKSKDEYLIIHDNAHLLASSWRNNRFYFNNTSLKEALTTIGRIYNVTFEIRDPQINQYTYTLNCSSTDIHDVLHIMSTITPIQISKKNDQVYVVKQL